jgi:hypothetical protein
LILALAVGPVLAQQVEQAPEAQEPAADPGAERRDEPATGGGGIIIEQPQAQPQTSGAEKEKTGIEWGAWPDWVIVVFTGVLVWLSWRQHKLETRLASETSDAMETARKSAEASVIQAKAAEAATRALMFFHDTKPATWAQAHTFEVWWTNIGNAPAIITGVRVACTAADEPPDPTTAKLSEIPAGAVVPAGALWQRGTVFRRNFDPAFKKGETVYLYGEITYRDAMGGPRRSWFCRRYTGSQFVLDDITDWDRNGYQ